MDREDLRPEGETALKSALVRGALLAAMLGLGATCMAHAFDLGRAPVLLSAYFGAGIGFGAAPLALIERRIRRPFHVVVLSTLTLHVLLTVGVLQGFYVWGLLESDGSVTHALEGMRSPLENARVLPGFLTETLTERLVVGLTSTALCVLPGAIVCIARVRGLGLGWQVPLPAASSFVVVSFFDRDHWYAASASLAWPVLVLAHELAEFGERKLLRGPDPWPSGEKPRPVVRQPGWKAPIAGLVAIALCVFGGAKLRTKWAHDADAEERRRDTLKILEALAGASPGGFGRTGPGDYGIDVVESGDTCLRAKAFFLSPTRQSTQWRYSRVGSTHALEEVTDSALLDWWGYPIQYRCPGPVHKNGWDLISCGPNGVYEEGGGDDIVVGEDLPGGIAAISSESGR